MKLPMAYVFLNTDIGSEHDVLYDLKAIEGVQEVFSLMGIYDVIARINADTMDQITHIVNRILRVDRVHSKLTVVCCAEQKTESAKEPLLVTA